MALTSYVSGLIVQSVPTKGNMKVERFTADGTFTPPAGVTYAVAHIRGGGGGVSEGATAGTGGTSSVAFAGGTISATGGAGQRGPGSPDPATAGATNSGLGGLFGGGSSTGKFQKGSDGAYIVAGGAVTPGTGITVTVGAGGTSSHAATGGSGYVWIEYLA